MKRLGNLYVVAAPSGVGKTTLVKAVVDSLEHVSASISHTTRCKRPTEQEGINYFFIAEDEFHRMIAAGEFLEYAYIFNNLYGTSKRWVEETLQQGIDVILEIDWQGHQQIKYLFPHSLGIFILPPSLKILHERLLHRSQDSAESIKKRFADVRETVSHINEFDYIIINDDFSTALNQLKTIILAGRLAKRHQLNCHAELINDLMTEE